MKIYNLIKTVVFITLCFWMWLNVEFYVKILSPSIFTNPFRPFPEKKITSTQCIPGDVQTNNVMSTYVNPPFFNLHSETRPEIFPPRHRGLDAQYFARDGTPRRHPPSPEANICLLLVTPSPLPI